MATSLWRKQGEQFADENGNPLNGGLLYFFEAGTDTPQDTFLTATGAPGDENTNPVVLGSDGRLQTPIYFGDSDSYSNYKEELRTSTGVLVDPWPADNIPAAAPDATAVVSAPPSYPWIQEPGPTVNLTAADLGNAYEVDTTSGDVTFNLPAVATCGNGPGFTFKKVAGANKVIINPSGSEELDGSSASYEIVRLMETKSISANAAAWNTVTDALDYQSIARAGVDGLTIVNNTATPTTQLDIAASSAVLVDDSGIVFRTGALTLTIDATTIGANGIDTGALANNTWYYVWLIATNTATAALLSLSSTAPTLPAGYTSKLRIGAVRAGGSGTFLRTQQKGRRAQYVVVTGSTTPNLPIILSNVTAGSITVPTWVSVDVSAFFPPTAVSICGHSFLSGSGNAFMLAPNNAYGAFNSTTNPPPFAHRIGSANTEQRWPFDMMLESVNLFYATAAGVHLVALGWTDGVNAS